MGARCGYLLDEIRRNGEKAELKDEVVKLAKKHGITTPYTSYLVVPDVATPTLPQTVTTTPTPPTRFLRRSLNEAEAMPPASAPGNVGTPLQTFQSGSVTTIQPNGASFSGSGTNIQYAPVTPMQPLSSRRLF